MTDSKYGSVLAIASLFMVVLFICATSLYASEKDKSTIRQAEAAGLQYYINELNYDVGNLTLDINKAYDNLTAINKEVNVQTDLNAKYQNQTRQLELDVDNLQDAINRTNFYRDVSIAGGISSIIINALEVFWAVVYVPQYTALKATYDTLTAENAALNTKNKDLVPRTLKTRMEALNFLMNFTLLDQYGLNMWTYQDWYASDYDGFTKEAFRRWANGLKPSVVRIKAGEITFGVALKKAWDFSENRPMKDDDAYSYSTLDFKPRKIIANRDAYNTYNQSNFIEFGTDEIVIGDHMNTTIRAGRAFDLKTTSPGDWYYYNSSFNISYIGVTRFELYASE